MASLVTNLGKANNTAAWLAYASLPKFVGWGTGSGGTAVSTDLVTPGTESRTSGTASQQTTTTNNDTFQVTGTITATGTRSITEVGLFDAAGAGNPPVGGNLDVYGDFTAIGLSSGDSIAFTIQVKVS